MARKIQRKELRKPDELIGLGARLLDWIADQRAPLAIGLGSVLLIVFGVTLVIHLRRSAAVEEARPLLDAVKIRAFREAPEGEAPAPPGTGGLPPIDPAALAAAADEADEPTIRALARLPLARLALDEGRLDEAAELYRGYLAADGGKSSPGRSIAQEGLGYALERAGKTEEADKAFAALGEIADGAWSALALYHRGRLAAAAGRVEDARKLFGEAKALGNPRLAGITEKIDIEIRLLDRRLPAGAGHAPAAVQPGAAVD